MRIILFDHIAEEVAKHFQYKYPPFDMTKVKAYLEHVSTLPEDAKEIY